MNKRRILLISSLCLLLGSNTSLAGERTEREMLSIAQSQLAKGAKTRSAQSVSKLVEERFYSVYGNETQGFVIVSRDNCFTPVIGYSDTKFETDNLPCGMKWWLEAISYQMEANASLSFLAASRSVTRTSRFTPTPYFCKTEWDQGDPYNFYAPEFKGSHAPTGCVATAMSQIMKFFNYPAKGKGKGYYTIEGNSTRVTEDVTGVYEWDKMQDKYSDFDLTDDVRIPVARLMKDAGLATHMNYGSNGSGAFSVEAARGFAYNFGYDSLAMHCFYRQYFDEEAWMQCIYDELGSGRPILYTGVTGSSGHAFIFDGIDEDGKIHVNWGWGGSCNGYYDFADLNPVDEQGKASNDHYNVEQSMVFGFKCQEQPDEEEKYQSLWCTNKPYKLSVDGKIILVECDAIYNYHFLWFYGDLGLNFENMDGEDSKTTFISLYNTDGTATFHGTGNMTTSKFFNKVKPGKYRVYMASKAVNEDVCQYVRFNGGALYYDLIIGEDGTTSLSEQKTKKDTTLGVENITSDFRVTNHIYDLQGRSYSSSANLKKGVYVIGGKKVMK